MTISDAESTADFFRLFVNPGPGHGHNTGETAGAMVSGTMIALMRWVEKGIAPEEILAERLDPATAKTTMSRPIYPYPTTSRYRGNGDPNEASSFTQNIPAQ